MEFARPTPATSPPNLNGWNISRFRFGNEQVSRARLLQGELLRLLAGILAARWLARRFEGLERQLYKPIVIVWLDRCL